jgi:diguanylate cyclase (GGDEF)-like protein/PAS domain S-box-containing protein
MSRPMSPILRITIALVGITLALVVSAYALRILPDSREEALDNRKRTVEALTVQVSSPVMLQDPDAIGEVLDTLVERNDEVISAGLRDAAGELVIDSGSHAAGWKEIIGGRSTAEYVRVPVFAANEEVGALEVHFAPLPSPWQFSVARGGLGALLLFLAVGGAGGYFFVLRRSLKALDPAAVIPDRVRLAMDTLVEGVIIVDDRQNILLVNRAFAALLGVPAAQLIGKEADSLNWRSSETGGAPGDLPWEVAMAKGAATTDRALDLRAADGVVRSFAVNATPVLDPKGKVIGALASFDDVTELRQQHGELQRAMVELEQSRKAMEKQNTELQYLATRDPLTGCLNRRAFFESFEGLFTQARATGEPLSCAMLDIDHFKKINDQFGHGTGDRVIAFVAETIRLGVRNADLVARYGGEEYCVVFPGRTPAEAAATLEKIREAVIRGAGARFTSAPKLTISAGVAALRPDEELTAALLERADAALYASKNTGRNRVTLWSLDLPSGGKAEDREKPGVEKRPKTGISGVWKGAPKLANAGANGLHRMPGASHLDAFRDQSTQSLALAARHQWTAALLRIEFTTIGLGAERAAAVVVERVENLLRRSDTLALLAGANPVSVADNLLPRVSPVGPTELGVLLPDVADINAIGRVVQRLIETISVPVDVDGTEAFATCAVGIAVAPVDGEDFDTLMRNADQARRACRENHSVDRYAFYQRSMTETLLRASRIESGLRRALERDELQLVYQPQIELATGKVCGLEALLRWNDADGTPVPPDQFIPIAESTGLIGAIGDWVLERGCRQAHAWQQESGVARRVAVNVSAVQIMSKGFSDRVAAILEATGVDPRLIELEITETAFMSDLVTAASKLRDLRRLGLHIALDDFGTGYSSLSYLKQLPIDSVKIDSRFVRGLNDTREGVTLVTAIVGMAHGLGIRVVAEGVESPHILQLLARLGCDEAQGYVISRPVPVAEAFAAAESEYELSEDAVVRRAALRRIAPHAVPVAAPAAPAAASASGQRGPGR